MRARILRQQVTLGGFNVLNDAELKYYAATNLHRFDDVAAELLKRKQERIISIPQVRTSLECYRYLQPLFGNEPVEQFWAIFLNRNNKVIAHRMISRGGIDSTVVDIRVLFRLALSFDKCTAMVVSHNHPSENTQPSEQDRKLTKQLSEAGKIIGVQLIDHLIICSNAYLSFADEGLM